MLDSSPRLVAGLKKPHVQLTREYTFDRPATSLAPLIANVDFTANWRPLLRAARAGDPIGRSDKRFLFKYLEIHCDGVVEYGFVRDCNPETERSSPLYGDRVIAQVAVVAGWIDSLREFAGATCAEYAIEVAISVRDQPLLVRPRGAGSGGSHYEQFSAGKLPSGTQLFLGRRYPFTIQGESEALSSVLLSRVEMDLYHAAGLRCLDGHSLTVTSTGEEKQ